MSAMPHLASAVTAVLGSLLCGCAVGGSRGGAPQTSPVTSGDTGVYLYSCGQWMREPPQLGRRLLDIKTHSHDTVTDASTLAARVRAAGGRVLHIYSVPRVRAEIDVAQAIALTGEVATVPDSARLDVPMWVSLRAPLPAEDSARLAASGASFRAVRFGPGWLLGGTIPDSVIPRLGALPEAWDVRPMPGVCRTSSHRAVPSVAPPPSVALKLTSALW